MATTTTTSGRSALEILRAELPAVWQAIPDKGLFLGLLAAWVALFHLVGNSTFGYVDTPSLWVWMYRLYTVPNSEDGHGLLIPLVVLGLCWWKREQLRAQPVRVWWPALLALAGCLGLHAAGYLIQQPRVSIVALLGGIYALLALVWGWRLARASFFPFVLFVFCIPVGTIADPVTVPLRHVSTDIAVGVVRHAMGIPVLQEGVQIMDPKGAYNYEVAAACSGIRSLITLLALTTIYGFVAFTRAWKRGLMVLLAAPLALLGNVIRLVAIVVAAEAFGQAAGEFVHNWFGFVTFAIALAVLLTLGHWLREPTPVRAPAPLTPPS